MKKRYKKKRKQQQYIEGLERGNQYLADLVGRLMQEKANIQTAFKQIEDIYQGYIVTIVKDLGLHGGVVIPREHIKEVMAEYKLQCEADEERIWLMAVENGEEGD